MAGIAAEFEKKSTFGHLVKINLNPIGDKKFLLLGCDDAAFDDREALKLEDIGFLLIFR